MRRILSSIRGSNPSTIVNLLSLLFLLTQQSIVAQNVNANVAGNSSSAGSLSPILSPAFAGMGIEPTNLIAFTGSTTPNALTMNLLNNLKKYTGVPPHLRIGGNSGDNILYSSDSQYDGAQVYNNSDASGSGTYIRTDEYIIGPGYFAAMDLLPQGTPITYGLNMAYNGADYLQQIVNQANAALNGLSNVTVVGFEVGNEPDLYVQNGYRPSGWTVDNFGSEWLSRVSSIYATLLQPKGLASNFFEPATTATTATDTGKQYRIANLVTTDVANSNGIYVAGWNQHDYYYYTDVSTYTLTLSLLMNLGRTVTQFAEWAGQSKQAQVTGKPYYLREMGSVGPEGIQGISNTFGATLWTLNFFLYAATLQVSSVQMHMTQTSYASPWIPISSSSQQAGVQVTYYAWAAIDQIIGPSCQTTISALTLTNYPTGYSANNLVAYASYKGEDLATIIMINTNLAYSGSSKNSANFVLSIPSLAGQTLYLSSLTASGADSTSNVTWNGMSYEESGDGTPTEVGKNSNTVQVGSDGTVTIPVQDSSAIVAAVGQVLGSDTNVDTSACSTLSTEPEGGETNASGTTASGSAPTFQSTGGFISGSRSSLNGIPKALLLVAPAILCGFFYSFR